MRKMILLSLVAAGNAALVGLLVAIAKATLATAAIAATA